MAEEKKKATSKTTEKKEVAKKEVEKKTSTKKTTPEIKKETIKNTKSTTKKTTDAKEPTKKRRGRKKSTTKAITKEEKLERTLIFDGSQKKNLKEVVEKLEKENVVLKDKVVKRSKIKKWIVIILGLIIILSMIATSIYLGVSIKKNIDKNKPIDTLNTNIYNKVNEYRGELQDRTDEEKDEDKKEEKSILKTISLAQFEKKILAKENINVLVSSSTCYFCLTFEPIIEENLKDSDKTIYRIDVAELEDEEVETFRKYYAFTITPTLFVVKDGIVTAEKLGTMSEEDLKIWTEENLV